MPLPRWACILQSSPNAQWGGHLISQSSIGGHGGLGLRIFKGLGFWKMYLKRMLIDFLELLNVFEHANLKKQKQRRHNEKEH
jgi:hypothetical protein